MQSLNDMMILRSPKNEICDETHSLGEDKIKIMSKQKKIHAKKNENKKRKGEKSDITSSDIKQQQQQTISQESLKFPHFCKLHSLTTGAPYETASS